MHWRRKWQPTPVFLPGESQGGGAWWAAVSGVTQSRTQLKQLSSSSRSSVLWIYVFSLKLHEAKIMPAKVLSAEKAMAPHSSTLAWKIPRTEEPVRLQSMGSLRVSRLSDFTFTFHFHALEKEMAAHSSVLAWRIPGTGEPGGCRLWGHTESDTTEVT